MSKKITIGAALALALIMVAVAIPLTYWFAENRLNALMGDLYHRVAQAHALEEIRAVVQSEFYRNFNEDDIIAEMVSGFVQGLEDEHSRYLPPEQWNAFLQRLEGQQSDIGLQLRYVPSAADDNDDDNDVPVAPEPGMLEIAHVALDSPAGRAGLLSGDRLVRVETEIVVLFDEENLSTYNADSLITNILNVGFAQAEGVSTVAVDFVFMRDDERQEARVLLGTGVPTVATELMADANGQEGAIGYIRIFSFFRNTANDLDTAMRNLEAAGAGAFIIDLRGTYDGTLPFAVEAANLLLPASRPGDAIATVQFHGERESQSFVSDAFNIFDSIVTQGMVVLMDENTAGPAELFAYALSVQRPAEVVLVGRPTRGVNTVQGHFALAQVGGGVILSVGTIIPVGGDANWNLGGVLPSPPSDTLQYNPYSDASQLQGAIRHLTPVAGDEE
ncbi:MAG: S41 family peptidase [Oscillospiraceae bacterium]|nr:S41 family peptidase [Oscillospiraceae bacterium]